MTGRQRRDMARREAAEPNGYIKKAMTRHGSTRSVQPKEREKGKGFKGKREKMLLFPFPLKKFGK
jgi:hypothetical protein